jgi:hypothetical protein
MPVENAPSVTGGPERRRRSHRFLADKDEAMLREGVQGHLEVSSDGMARFWIENDRVGHYLPSGGNQLLVYLRTFDELGRLVGERKEAVGKKETLLLDFWPFNIDGRIAPGGRREFEIPLPSGHGRVEALVRYWDWMHAVKTVLTLERAF